MAFVARRSSEGKVVDRHQVSGGCASRSLILSDISDEDTPDSVMGYTDRTYGAPTVRRSHRFMGQGDDCDGDDIKGELEDNLDMDVSDEAVEDSVDSYDSYDITNFCNELDEEEAKDAMHRLKFEAHQGVSEDSEGLEDLCEDDRTDEQTMMGKLEDTVTTDTETVMNIEQDLQSLCSYESFTPTMTQRDEYNNELDNISVKTYLKEDNQDNMSGTEDMPTKDKMSAKTFKEEQQASLSARTFLKQASVSKSGRQRVPEFDQLSNRTYDRSTCGSLLGSPRGNQHDVSSMSTCSWTDMYRGALPSDGRSGIVPKLSLDSVGSEASTYYKNMDEDKERHSKTTFDDWKARKAAQKQKSLLAAKQEREKRETDAALRKQQAQARFQEWCRRKEEQQQKQRKKPMNPSQSGSGNTSGSISTSGSGSGSVSGPVSGPLSDRKAASEATRNRLKEWQVNKTKQLLKERERKRHLEENKQKLEEERKQRSQGAWKNWMKQVDKRAKPVPLNQGFDTLRGTISNIYINPVQWVSNIDPKESGRSR